MNGSSVSMEEMTRVADAEVYERVGPKLRGPVPGLHSQRVIAHDESLLSPSYTRGHAIGGEAGAGVPDRGYRRQ